MRYVIFLSLALMACGPSEKNVLAFKRLGEGGPTNNCAPNYQPMEFYREGFTPITDPTLLPAGSYRLVGTEVLLRQENATKEKVQAHFLDRQTGGEIRSERRCASTLQAREYLSVSYDGLKEFRRGAADSYVPVTTLIQGAESILDASKLAPGAPVASGILPVLSQWDRWVIYRLNQLEYEINYAALDISGNFQVYKLMSQKFAFVAASAGR